MQGVYLVIKFTDPVIIPLIITLSGNLNGSIIEVLPKVSSMEPVEEIRRAIAAFSAVEWVSCGYPLKTRDSDETIDAGWVKFQLTQDRLGFRTLEFLSWAVTDMLNAGERLRFFPVSPPPYLNEPGKSVSFVLECYAENGDHEVRFKKVAEFIDWCRAEHWDHCRGRLTEKGRTKR